MDAITGPDLLALALLTGLLALAMWRAWTRPARPLAGAFLPARRRPEAGLAPQPGAPRR